MGEKAWPYIGQIGKQKFIIEGITHSQQEHGFFIDYSLLGENYSTFSHGPTPPEIIGTVVTDIMQRAAIAKAEGR
jgi:hypothetical protein